MASRSKSRPGPGWTSAVLLAVVVAAFAVRMVRIGDLRMWGDEAYSVYSANRSLAAITFEGAENDPHPPLYYYLLHLYLPLAGASELAVRFFSVFPGVATVALVYATGKRLFGARAGRMAAALAAVSPFDVYYSQEIRMYALAIFLTALALYLFVRLLQAHDVLTSRVGSAVVGAAVVEAAPRSGPPWPTRAATGSGLYDSGPPRPTRAATGSGPYDGGPPRPTKAATGSGPYNGGPYNGIPLTRARRAAIFGEGLSVSWLWLAYAVTMFLALYSLYHVAFVFLAEGLYLLTYWRTRRAFVLRWFATSAGVVALFLPWLLLRFSSTWGHLQDRAGHAVLSLPMFVARGFAALTVGATVTPSVALPLSAAFAFLIAGALVVAWRNRKANAADGLVLTLTVVPILAVYPLYLLLPIFVARLFALALVPLALVLARSLSLIDWRAAAGGALVLSAVGIYSLGSYYQYDRYNAAAEDYVPLIEAVEAQAQPGDVVLFHAYWQIGYFLSHYRGAPLQYLDLDKPADLDAALSRPRNVWAVLQGPLPHGSEVWLARHTFSIGQQAYGQMRLISYRAGRPERGEDFSSPVLFGNGMALLGYRMNRAPVESGRGLVTVELDWQTDQTIAGDYTVSVRLTTGSPRDGPIIWTQEDNQPADGTLRTGDWKPGEIVADRHAFVTSPGTPPGDYTVQIVVYDSQTGRPASIVAPDNVRGQGLALGSLAVSRPSVPVAVAPATKPIQAQWDEIALIGADGGGGEIMPGDTLPLTLYWQARVKPTHNYVVNLLVVDASGGSRAAASYRPANSSFPTRDWSAGQVWRDQVRVTVDAGAAPGPAAVYVFLTDEESDRTLAVEAGEPTRDVPVKGRVAPGDMLVRMVRLAEVQIIGRDHQFQLPAPQNGKSTNLENKVKLLGYDLARTTLEPSESIKVSLYWQALDQMNERLTVFIHVVDSAGDLVAQQDGEPDGGRAPTTSWLRGEVIADAYEIALPPTLAPGEYTLEIGMYRPGTGQRLTVLDDASDHITLARVTVTAR